MAAGLITELTDVDLEDRDAARAQRENSSLGESQVERWRTARLIKDTELFSR
jgi:hypothetical protein